MCRLVLGWSGEEVGGGKEEGRRASFERFDGTSRIKMRVDPLSCYRLSTPISVSCMDLRGSGTGGQESRGIEFAFNCTGDLGW